MEQSEQQKAVFELGKLLVKELDLQKSVDTLSRWMAHYIAEKINYAEQLPQGTKKAQAEQECFSLILDLWKHRWHYKSDRQPLRNFNHLYSILEKLDPDKEEPYFYRFNSNQATEEINDTFKVSDLQDLSSFAIQIDKVARIWINFLLHDAAERAKNERIKKLIDHAVKLPDSMDAHIIQIVLDDLIEEIDKKSLDQEELDRKSKIKKLNSRIVELQKFRKINEYLINQYKMKLVDLK